MDDLSQTRLWMMRGAFVVLAVVILLFQLLPLETMPRNWAGPDVLLAFAAAWCLRRPEYVPPLALALAFLLADLLLQRPPGLWALLALIGCENLKSRRRSLRDAGFGTEWITVGVILIAITLLNRATAVCWRVGRADAVSAGRSGRSVPPAGRREPHQHPPDPPRTRRDF
jgi:rod shape-determining protein MreD